MYLVVHTGSRHLDEEVAEYYTKRAKMFSSETTTVIDLVKSWKTADYDRKKAVAMIMIHKIIISEDGSTKIVRNLQKLPNHSDCLCDKALCGQSGFYFFILSITQLWDLLTLSLS